MPHRPIRFVLLTALLVPALAAAQPDVLFNPETRGTIAPREPAEKSPAAVADPGPCPGHPWSIDLLLGTQTGLRAKRFFDGEKGYGWMIEASAGLDYVLFPFLGGGLRYGFAPYQGRYNSFSISPGVDLHAVANPFHNVGGWFGGGPTGFGLVNYDVDLSWRHVYTDSCSGELGLKLGAATPIGKVRHGTLPVVSIWAGIRF
jgi:hypothetical protein